MADREMKARIRLEGEQQFRQAMTGASNAIKVLNSEQKLAQAQFEATGNKEQFLADKADILRRKIEEQQKAVKAAQEAVQKLKDKGVEPTNKSMQEWTRKLNDSQAYLVQLQGDLNSTENELQQQGQAFEEAGDAAQNYSQQLDNIGTGFNLDNMISSLGALEQKLSSALSAVGRLAQGVYDAEVQASKWADDLIAQALMYNMDTETLQAWRYAAQFIDTDVETIISAQDKLMKSMTSESEDTQLMFNRFGVVTRNTDKSLRDVNETFWDTIEALRRTEDAHGKALTEAERDAAAQSLFGKSYRELIPLITAGRDAWDSYVQKGREVATVSEENVDALGEFNDAYNDMTLRLETLKNDVLAGLAEPMKQFSEAVGKAVTEFDKFLQSAEGQAALSELSAALSSLVETVTNIGFSFAFAVATAAIKGLTDVLEWINDHGLAVAIALGAIAGAVALIKVATPVLEMLKLLKSIQWLNMAKGAKSLGDAMKTGAPQKAAEAAGETAKGGGLLNLVKGVFGKFAPAAIAAAYAGTVTAPVWGTQMAEQRDFGRYWESEGQVDSVLAIEAAGDKKIAEAQAVLSELQTIAKEFESQSGGGLTNEQAQAIFAMRDTVEKQTGKSYAILDELEAIFKRNGGENTFETDYDLQRTLGEMIADLVEKLKTEADTAAETVKETAETATAEAGETTVEETTSGFDDIIAKYNKQIEEAYAKVSQDTDAWMAELEAKNEQAGTDSANGLANGISGSTAPQEAAGDMAQGVEDAVADTLQTHSPSVVMHNIGLGVAQGLANGINAGAAAAIAAAQNLAAQVNAALSSVQAVSIGNYGGSMGRALSASPSYGGLSGLGGSSAGSIINNISISGKQVAQSITPFVNRNMATALRASTR